LLLIQEEQNLIQSTMSPVGNTVSLDTPAIGTTATLGSSTTGVRWKIVCSQKFSRSKQIECINAIVFDAPSSQYDVILGRDYIN
jgi:hypothetical protein